MTLSLVLGLSASLQAQVYCNNFNENAAGWTFAYPGMAHKWSRVTNGGVNDSGSLYSKLQNELDYVASPPFQLEAGKEYTVSYKTYVGNPTPRNIYLAIHNQVAIEGREVLAVHAAGAGWAERIVNFVVEETGTYHLIYYITEGGYKTTYVDDFCLEERVPPEVNIHSPANGAVFNEGPDILISALGSDADGFVAKMEVFNRQQLVHSANGCVVNWNWKGYVPGNHQLRFVATDNRGNQTEETVDILINFSDGTLTDFVHWDFNGSAQGWSFAGGWEHDFSRGLNGTGGIYGHGIQREGNYSASSRFFLFAGETYQLSYLARSKGNNRTVRFMLSPDQEPGGEIISTQSLGASSESFKIYTHTFTAPADGGYHLLFLWPSSGTGFSYEKVFVDDVRISGNINASPVIRLTSPAKSMRVMEGALLKYVVEANDRDGEVVQVDFFAGDEKVGECLTPPYQFEWPVSGLGDIEIYAKAYDEKHADATSNVVHIDVTPNTVIHSSYLGDATTNSVRGSAILSDGTVVLAANIGSYNPGGTQLNLLDATAASSGAIIRISADGQTVLSTTRLAGVVTDMAVDAYDNLYVAAMDKGLVKLNATASEISWHKTYEKNALRVDASPSGNAVVLTSPVSDFDEQKISGATIYNYNPQGGILGSFGGPANYTTDVCIDESTQTIVAVGWKNIHTWEGVTTYPVDVSAYRGYAYDGTIKYNGYNWESQNNEDRFINKPENNMADSRSSRCTIGPDGQLYLLFEVDGGNHIFRYDPFDIMKQVNIVGGDDYHQFHFTGTEPKIFVGKYNAGDGAYLQGQQFTARLNDGSGNTVRTKNGGLDVDGTGRVYIIGSSAAGIPVNPEMLPGSYTGGSFLLVLSPDFSTRDLIIRPVTDGGGHTVSVSPSKIVFGGIANKGDLFLKNALLPTYSGTTDGFFMIADFNPFFGFHVSSQPRLYFDGSDVTDIRQKISTEPYNNMYEHLIDIKDLDYWCVEPYNPNEAYDVSVRAENYAFLYILTGEESYAQVAAEMTAQVIRSELELPWASPSLKGLSSYWMGRRVAHAYDWCKNSDSWDNAFCFEVSSALFEMGKVIIDDGGTEQNTAANSNWQGGRGASGGLCLLATDHVIDNAKLNWAYNRVVNYINLNVTPNESTGGWMPEGLGYSYYPMGNFIGPFGIAMARHDVTRDIRDLPGTAMIYWSMYATLSNSMSLITPPTGINGIKPDMANDNPNTAGEGSYGQAFYFARSAHIPGMRYWYDRTQGAQSPHGAIWDRTRNGVIWSILYYPNTVTPVNPRYIPEWIDAFDDAGANGMQVFRNNYKDGNDHVVQFNAKLRHPGGHWGCDGLSFRIIAEGTPFIVGGGRNNPGNSRNQPTVYPVDPDGDVVANKNLSTMVGSPLVTVDGGGHVIATTTKNNVDTDNHKRWFVANFNRSETLAEGTYLIADESSNGRYFQIPTYGANSITTSGNTFTITGENGSTMQGTVLYPTSNFRFVTGSKARGSDYGEYTDNNYLHLMSDDGSFIVALTVSKTSEHPAVTRIGGTGKTVDGTIVKVGRKEFTFTPDDVLYSYSEDFPTSIGETQSRSIVWPVPSTGAITVQSTQVDATAVVYNMQGVEVYRQPLNSTLTSLNLSFLAKGGYLLCTEGKEGIETHIILIN